MNCCSVCVKLLLQNSNNHLDYTEQTEKLAAQNSKLYIIVNINYSNAVVAFTANTVHFKCAIKYTEPVFDDNFISVPL